MDKTNIAQKWLVAQKIEKELQSQLNNDLPTFEDIEHLVSQLRIACEAVIFRDFEYGTKERVQHRLWDAHSLINTRYRKLVAHYRSGDQKRRSTERRKLEKHYVDFLKTSQFFYKGYIQRLASHYGPLPALQRIANRLSLSPLSVDKPVKVGKAVEHLIKMSCHFTLLRLGDLSRYRNVLRTKDRSWEPALGYYYLADALYPNSGSAHNQMAVIALAEGSHLDALYHLLRAVAVEEPHELARDNLAIEYKKISNSWEKEKHSKRRSAPSESPLVIWFVRLQARFYKGVAFSEQAELEREVLGQLAASLKDASFEETLNKLVLINMAANYLATERITEQEGLLKDDLKQSFYYLLGFNVQVLCVLLQTLISELANAAEAENLESLTATESSGDSCEKLNAVAIRVLPAIRQYFAWVISQRAVLVGLGTGVDAAATGPLVGHIQRLWKIIRDALTALVNVFPAASLPTLGYLLPEDEETVGFKPLRAPPPGEEDFSLYVKDDGSLKPRIGEGVFRQPENENYSRVHDILRAGIALHSEKDRSAASSGEHNSTYAPGPQSPVAEVSASPAQSEYSHTKLKYRAKGSESTSTGPSDIDMHRLGDNAPADPLDTDMLRMVENLVEPVKSLGSNNESSYGMHSSTANEVFAPIGSERVPKVMGNQFTPKKPFPSLPGIWSTPFTPQPNELQRLSPDGFISPGAFSSMNYATNQQQMAAASALDQMTGSRRGPAKDFRINGSQRSPTSMERSPSVNQLLQMSLAQQYGISPTSSFNFTANSSIEANNSPPKAYYARTVGQTSHNSFNDSTMYEGASDFDRFTMMQSSLYNGSQASMGRSNHTPPAGQGRSG